MHLDCLPGLSPHPPISEFSSGRCFEVRGSGERCELATEAACITRIAAGWSLQQHEGTHFQKVLSELLSRFKGAASVALKSRVSPLSSSPGDLWLFSNLSLLRGASGRLLPVRLRDVMIPPGSATAWHRPGTTFSACPDEHLAEASRDIESVILKVLHTAINQS